MQEINFFQVNILLIRGVIQNGVGEKKLLFFNRYAVWGYKFIYFIRDTNMIRQMLSRPTNLHEKVY